MILRDLHAGLARFQQLQEGLGLATNLLATRLAELTESGMIHKLDVDGQNTSKLSKGPSTSAPSQLS